jgi:F-type H+-transporting ATPase subunit gamma
MLAMDSANINATSLLEELKIQYNHLRQNAITTEITEISNERKRNDR